jgi:hypothetical protein
MEDVRGKMEDGRGKREDGRWKMEDVRGKMLFLPQTFIFEHELSRIITNYPRII